MGTLIAIPILGVLLILETAVLNQIPLLQGTADLVMLALVAWGLQKRVPNAWAWGVIGALFVGYVSAAPWGVYLAGYMVTVGIALFLRQRIWNVPLMAMVVATFLSTLVVQGLMLLTLHLTDTLQTVSLSINQIILPSLLINMILALPFYFIFGDLANLLYPEALEM